MKWTWIALVGLLSGCASYAELQQSPPLHEGHTNKPPQAFAECVLPAWVDLNAASHVMSSGNARTVVMPAQGPFANNTIASLTVSPDGSGALVAYRTPVSETFLGPRKQWAAAQACM